MDILTLLIMAAFYVLFAASIVRYWQHRDALELAVVLVFSSTAAIFAISVLNLVVPSLATYLGPVAVTLLVAQPALMVRLVGLIVPLPRWAAPLAVGGFLVSVLGFYATGRSTPAVLFLVAYFATTEFLAAAVLIREGRRRLGFPRVRLTIAGVASVLFGASILVSGLASAARGEAVTADPAVTMVSRLLALVAGLGYLGAFVPPRWVRRYGYRSLAFDLVRSIVSRPTGTQPQVLWGALASVAGNILGTSRVRITTTDAADPVVLETAGDDESRARDAAEGTAARQRYTVEVPLVSEGGRVGTLEAHLDGRPLFLEDDIALIELLGSLTARAVDREAALATLADAERQVSEAAAVRASEARFRALLDAEPNAMLSIDADGVILWCTKSADRMFDAESTSIVGRRLEELVAPSNDAHSPGVGADVLRYETTGWRRDGDAFPAEVALSGLELDGAPATLAVISDISWRREAEAVRDRFIGVLSHELRTPITSIFGGAQVLLGRGDQLDPATRHELLADVAAEAERLQRMVENLLILARVERGADVVDVSPVLLQRVLPAVLAREHAMWPSMSLLSDVPPDLPPVAGDEASLALVLRNLITNAGKYAGPDANVQVLMSVEPSGQVAVRVRDDGVGVDADEADRLFGLYYRSAASAAAPGSGIGLFVCRELVTAMGGRMWAGPAPRGGAEFGFVLPRYTDVEATEPDSVGAPSFRDARAAGGAIAFNQRP